MNKNILKQGINEFIEGGLDEENKQMFRLAVTAYFKAISQICDLILFEKIGFMPKNHSERFRILEKNNKELYFLVDTTFKMYRDTYSKEMDKELCKKIRNEISKIIAISGIREDFQEIIQKISR